MALSAWTEVTGIRFDTTSGAGAASAREVSNDIHSSQDLLEQFQGKTADAPMCMTCGTKMRPAGSCYVCEGCGSTSGCSGSTGPSISSLAGSPMRTAKL